MGFFYKFVQISFEILNNDSSENISRCKSQRKSQYISEELLEDFSNEFLEHLPQKLLAILAEEHLKEFLQERRNF